MTDALERAMRETGRLSHPETNRYGDGMGDGEQQLGQEHSRPAIRGPEGLSRRLNISMRFGLLIATLLGFLVAIWAIGSTGIDNILAVGRRIGPAGFLLYCLYSLLVFALLGAAWLAAAPGEPVRRLGLFTRARLLREAAADLLPFSQIGGLAVSAWLIAGAGVPTPRVYASLIVDLTTELASQLVFTLLGVGLLLSILAAGPGAPAMRPLILAGTGMMAALTMVFLVAQRSALTLAQRIARHMLPNSLDAIDGIGIELSRIYAMRRRVAAAFALNLASWIASALGAWIVLRLMGIELSVWTILSLESLIFALRSAAFAIPAGIGVQEAAYILAGPLLGLPPEAALALALAKRARDLAIAVPTLAVWQIAEGGKLAVSMRGR